MSDKAQIEKTLQAYRDCMFESSAAKTLEAFHANAKVTGYMGDALAEISVGDFAGLVESAQPSAKEKGETPLFEVLSIEIAGKTAVARVRDEFQGTTFLDTLSLINEGEKWSIYNKLFHIE